MRAAACGVPCVKKASSTNSPPDALSMRQVIIEPVLRQTGRGHRPGRFGVGVEAEFENAGTERAGLLY